MVVVAQCTGLRAEEVLAREWEDIDFENLNIEGRPGGRPRTGKQPPLPTFGAIVGERICPGGRGRGRHSQETEANQRSLRDSFRQGYVVGQLLLQWEETSRRAGRRSDAVTLYQNRMMYARMGLTSRGTATSRRPLRGRLRLTPSHTRGSTKPPILEIGPP